MSRRWHAFLATVAIATAASAGAAPYTLSGTWILESYYDVADDGRTLKALGDDPVGLMIFTDDGRASVNLMQRPVPTGAEQARTSGNCVPDWSCFYFGTYQLVEEGKAWVVDVQGGNMPAYIGTKQRREFRIDGNRLEIIGDYEADGRHWSIVRTFRRASGQPAHAPGR